MAMYASKLGRSPAMSQVSFFSGTRLRKKEVEASVFSLSLQVSQPPQFLPVAAPPNQGRRLQTSSFLYCSLMRGGNSNSSHSPCCLHQRERGPGSLFPLDAATSQREGGRKSVRCEGCSQSCAVGDLEGFHLVSPDSWPRFFVPLSKHAPEC